MSKARPMAMEAHKDAGPSALIALPGAATLSGDGPHAVVAGGLDLILLRTAGGLRVFQGRCPHQGALLSEGERQGDSLVCRNHGWRFDVDTGQRRGGRACLVACPVVERQGEISVDVSPLVTARRLAVRAPGGTAAAAARAQRTLDDLPGPRGRPLVGNALQMDLGTLHLVMEHWASQYGPMCKFQMGPQRGVIVSDADLSAQVLRARPETYRRTRKLAAVFRELHVDGVFSAEGSAWQSQRRLAMEALSQRHLRGFFPTLRAVAARLGRRWARAADAGDALDIVEDLKRFTVDVTTALTFGHDVNTIDQTGDDVVQRRLELLFPAFNRRIFALVPWWRLVRMPRDRRLDRTVAELRVWLDGLVAEARARAAQAEPSRSQPPANFLEAMLAARDEAGQPFTDEVIFANLMTMLLAGEDTTAYTLAWAVHHLCDNPEAVQALRVELDQVLGAAEVPHDLDTANRLAYAGAVANEAMRLRPVAPLIVVESIEATIIGDVEIPANTVVVVLTRLPTTNATHFPDPGAFNPARWLDAGKPGDGGGGVNTGYIPFGSGPRICPGRSLALVEMKVVLALLYRSFVVTRDGQSGDVRERFAFTMSPEGLKVRLQRRA